MKRVDPLEDLLGLVHALPPLLRQVAQTVPLVADVLAPLVDDGAVQGYILSLPVRIENVLCFIY